MEDKINNIMIVLGSIVGVSTIENIMGIILLSFQILLILIKFTRKIYNKLKKKDYNISEDLKQLEEDIGGVIDNERVK